MTEVASYFFVEVWIIVEKLYLCGLKKETMKNTSSYHASAAMSNLWAYLQGLSLSLEDRHWLADKLLEKKEKKAKKAKKELVFPHIDADFKMSPELQEMVLGPVPEGFDIDKELEQMWEERAK